jgi:hypothetical protein
MAEQQGTVEGLVVKVFSPEATSFPADPARAQQTSRDEKT